MSTALQTIPEGTLDDRLRRIENFHADLLGHVESLEAKLDESLRIQREIATFANSLADLVNGFDASSIPAPFRAMLGMRG